MTRALFLLPLSWLLACATPAPAPLEKPAPPPPSEPAPIAEPEKLAVGDAGLMADPAPAELAPALTDGGVPLYVPAPEKPAEVVEEEAPPPEEEDAPPPAKKSDPAAYQARRAEAQKLRAARKLPDALRAARAAESEAALLGDREAREAAEATGRIAVEMKSWPDARRAFDRALQRCEAKGLEGCRKKLLASLSSVGTRGKMPGVVERAKKLAEADGLLKKVLPAAKGDATAKKAKPEADKALALYRGYKDPSGAARARALRGALLAAMGQNGPAWKELVAADRACREARCKESLRPFLGAAATALANAGDLELSAKARAVDSRAAFFALPPDARRYRRTPELQAACDKVNALNPGRCLPLIKEAIGDFAYRDFSRESRTGPLSPADLAATYQEFNGLLQPCFLEEGRRSHLVGQFFFDVEWTVGNNGHVAEVHMGKRSEDGSALHKCLSDKLSIWRYPRFGGERANVTQSFEVKGT